MSSSRLHAAHLIAHRGTQTGWSPLWASLPGTSTSSAWSAEAASRACRRRARASPSGVIKWYNAFTTADERTLLKAGPGRTTAGGEEALVPDTALPKRRLAMWLNEFVFLRLRQAYCDKGVDLSKSLMTRLGRRKRCALASSTLGSGR
jgi:hypothetical protein